MEFLGYERPDGSIGVRNHVLILPSTGCANTLAIQIANQVRGVLAATHSQGCGQLGEDREQTYRTLVGIGKNPNVAACLVVGLGCEQVSADKLANNIAATGKPTESIIALDEGGIANTIAKSIKTLRKMVQYASEIKRKPFSIDNLIVGVKCALTDTTSGIAANPAVGNAVDRIIEHGGTAIFTEIPEIIGAEHILAGRAVNSEVARQIIEVARRVEEHIKTLGVDIRGANPSPGNIRAGITTIEEKSLGAILKSGLSKVMGVLKYGDKPIGKGLYLMNGPGRTHEALTGLVSSGVTIIVMPTGGGSPSGSPITPTIKVTGNPKTAVNLEEYIDVDVSTVLRGEEGIEQAGERVFGEIINVASGKRTKIESLGYGSIAIYTLWSHV